MSGEKRGDALVFRVWDNGKGMESEKLEKVRRIISGEQDPKDPSGFGLFNVNQRIHLNYGNGYGLTMNSVYGSWTEAVVTIPAEKE